ncbi:MAG: radical SAM protein [Acidobacteria bacterium]|nr:radical SAM protein [Acidobacteriota bacterium]
MSAAFGTPVNLPRFRPPAEAGSLVLQVDEGCPHNTCTFCGMYKGMRFRPRPLEEIRALVAAESARDPDARRVFLADGDVLHRDPGELASILEILGAALPRLARVAAYANGRSLASKTAADLSRLRALRLRTLYLGLESGDEATLRSARKGETAATMVEGCRRAAAAGLRVSVMVLLGLSGPARSQDHARATADALNRMDPPLLSALRVIPVPGTPLHRDLEAGRFQPLTAWEAVRELRWILEGLDLHGTVFRADHASNVVPLEGRLPRDREALLGLLDQLLASDLLDRRSPGPAPLWL